MWRKIEIWYRAIRPFSLSASVVPVVVGSALASRYGVFDGWLFLLMLLGSVLVQSGANLVDEYADHALGQAAGKVPAPYKVIARGDLTPRGVRRGAAVCFGLATILGAYLVARTGWPLALVCLASAAVAYGYSAGPRSLGALGLGEPLVFVFMGPIMVMSTFYVYSHDLNWLVVWLSVPIGCLVTAILVLNNLRDVDEDRQNGKASIATVWGHRAASYVFCGLLMLAFGSLAVMVLGGTGSWAWLAPFLVFPQGMVTAKKVYGGRERAVLHQALRSAASLHLRFGLLLAVALSPLVSAFG